MHTQKCKKIEESYVRVMSVCLSVWTLCTSVLDRQIAMMWGATEKECIALL